MRPVLRLGSCAALVLPLLLASCVTLRFDRRRGFEPVANDVLDDLRARHADLTTCLATLGAPNLVYEQPADGFAIAYAWLDQFGWGLNASASLRGVSISADVGGDLRKLEGAVLFFDRDLRLTEVDRGLLRDFLVQPRRRQPAAVD